MYFFLIGTVALELAGCIAGTDFILEIYTKNYLPLYVTFRSYS